MTMSRSSTTASLEASGVLVYILHLMMHDVGMSSRAPIQAVDRALHLLAAIATADEPLSTAELARRAGVNRSTAWRLLATLEAHRLVDRDPASGGFRVGYGAVRLATAAGPAALVHAVRPTLEWLSRKTGESTQLTVAEGDMFRVVDEVIGPAVLTVRWLGQTLEVEQSSVGKLLYALRPREDLDRLLASRKLRDPAAFRRRVEQARKTGIGTSIGEHELDVNGYSSAIVSRDTPVAFLSVSGPAARVPPARLRELAPLLLQAAGRAQRALGLERRRSRS
jgi:IclR family acetate operon transcriptional repressor